MTKKNDKVMPNIMSQNSGTIRGDVLKTRIAESTYQLSRKTNSKRRNGSRLTFRFIINRLIMPLYCKLRI